MKVRIHDMNYDPVKTYEVGNWTEAHDSTDKFAAREAFESGEVVTIGKVIAEPVR